MPCSLSYWFSQLSTPYIVKLKKSSHFLQLFPFPSCLPPCLYSNYPPPVHPSRSPVNSPGLLRQWLISGSCFTCYRGLTLSFILLSSLLPRPLTISGFILLHWPFFQPRLGSSPCPLSVRCSTMAQALVHGSTLLSPHPLPEWYEQLVSCL